MTMEEMTAGEMMSEEMRLAVKRGAHLLDEIRPGWERRVNVERLDMKSCTNCLVGQLTGGYTGGIQTVAVAAGHRLDDRFSSEHGFELLRYDFSSDSVPWAWRAYGKLRSAWVEQIRLRLDG